MKPTKAPALTALGDTNSFLVEAPAGSGKTGLLIQRFLKLLAAENVTQPEQIRAITFTRKASAEMRDRVLAQLQAASDATEPRNPFDRLTRPLALAALDRDRRLGWQLLANPRRLKIGTIDSLCLEIARALPVLSGSAGALKPTTDAAPLYAEAARRTLMQLGGPDAQLSSALEDLLLHRDASLHPNVSASSPPCWAGATSGAASSLSQAPSWTTPGWMKTFSPASTARSTSPSAAALPGWSRRFPALSSPASPNSPPIGAASTAIPSRPRPSPSAPADTRRPRP